MNDLIEDAPDGPNDPMPTYLKTILRQAAKAAGPREICGFVLKGWRLWPVTNLAKDGHFEMQGDEILGVYRHHMDELLGMYHSHPDGREDPSDIDTEYAPPYLRYWIIAGEDVYEWDMQVSPPQPVRYE